MTNGVAGDLNDRRLDPISRVRDAGTSGDQQPGFQSIRAFRI
jgi:hypothetical protein